MLIIKTLSSYAFFVYFFGLSLGLLINVMDETSELFGMENEDEEKNIIENISFTDLIRKLLSFPEVSSLEIRNYSPWLKREYNSTMIHNSNNNDSYKVGTNSLNRLQRACCIKTVHSHQVFPVICIFKNHYTFKTILNLYVFSLNSFCGSSTGAKPKQRNMYILIWRINCSFFKNLFSVVLQSTRWQVQHAKQ